MISAGKIWNLISQFIGPLALVASIIFGVNQCNRANRAEKSKQVVTEYIKSKVDIDTIVDEKGLEHAVFNPNVVSRDEIINNRVDSVGSVIDSIVQRYKDKIQSLTVTNAELRAITKGIKKDGKTIYKDSVIRWVFNPETDTLDFTANLKTHYLTYTDGKKVLGFDINPQTIHTDIWWNDKRIKFNSVNSIHVESELPKNTLGLSINSEYRFNNNSVMVGPEANINLNKWTFNGRYLYNLNTGQKEPSVGIKFNIFK